MRPTSARGMLTAVALLLAAGSAAAQPAPGCRGDENPVDCFERLWTGLPAAEAAAETREAVAERVTPADSPAIAPGSLKDFLPLLFSNLGLGQVDDEEGSLSLSFDPLSPFGLPADGVALFTATAFDPEPYEAMIGAAPEGQRADLRAALSENLEDFDDLDIALSVNLQSDRFGRSLRDHPDLQALYGEIARAASEDLDEQPKIRLAQLLFGLGQSLNQSVETMDFDEIELAAPGHSALVEQAVIEAASSEAEVDRRLAALLEVHQFPRLADLFNNQPQLHAEVHARNRADAVGPDVVGGKVTYEHGFLNVNSLRNACGGAIQLSCYRAYVDGRGTLISRAPRLTVRFEYEETDAFDFELAEPEIAFSAPKGEVTTASLTYGQYVRALDPAAHEARFELDATYENATGDPARNDRFVATGTWIQELSDGTAASLSLVYASKPEYLGEVDEELGARVGLKYKLDRKAN